MSKKPVARTEMIDHLKTHIKYPATKKQLTEACNKMMDISAPDREWFIKNLPDRTYKNADEVIKALKL